MRPSWARTSSLTIRQADARAAGAPRPRRLASPEALEYVGQVLTRNPDTGIGDVEDRLTVALPSLWLHRAGRAASEPSTEDIGNHQVWMTIGHSVVPQSPAR
jgi:hypothetical protein